LVRLKRHSVQTPAESLVRTVNPLSTQLGIRPAVTLLESPLVAVPSAVGFLHPVILLPASALTGLSPEQLEALLAHELAHVRRHDYLVNVLQCIVETLLFYHPAMWWMSGRIRAERENCCDDLAVSISGSRLLYARALVDMANLGKRQHRLTAAADGADLASRIRRVMGIAPVTSERISSWWAGALLLAILGCIALLLSPPAIIGAAQAAVDEAAAAKENTESEDNASSEEPPEDPVFRVFDSFDGKLELDWEVIRPDPTHVSLEKNPGRLTITSQFGGLFQDQGNKPPGRLGNNIYMIPNPVIEGGDFVVTTCLELFHPERPYQQAGPHIYDDDDNYLKAIIARNDLGVLIGTSWETKGEFGGRNLNATGMEWDRLWLRIIKRGRYYESAYSLDGKEYTVIGERVWGDGAPQRIGLAVMNENATPDPLDAAFDFFEVRSLTDEEKNDPIHLQRRKLHGTWEVVSARLGGTIIEESPLSRFVFHGIEVTFSEKDQRITSRYVLHPDKDPKELVLTGVARQMWKDTRSFEQDRNLANAIYSIEQNRLVICMDPRPAAPAPTELKTNEGDGRLLIELRRMSEVEIAAIARNELPAKEYVNRLDTNDDEHLSIEEFTADWPAPEAVKQGTEVFQIIDRDGDDKMTVDELKSKPMRAVYLLMDLNADGVLTFREFSLGSIGSASAARTRRVFTSTDRNRDQTVSYEEFHDRPREAWFHSIDLNGDGEMSLEEFARDNARLVQNGSHREAFGAIDRNGDGKVQMAEYCQRVWHPQTAFRGLDRDGDDALVLREFVPRGGDRNDVQKATDVFAIIDRDRDGKLTLEEYTTRPREALFREYDDSGDGGLDLKEFHSADMKRASAARVQRAFALVDKNGDGQVSFEEFYSRPNEAWFHRMDVDEDGRMSLAEYSEGNPALVQSGRIQSVFAAIDRNGDKGLSLDEFAKKPQEALFRKQDADGDEKLTFQEFCLWRHTPEQVAAAKEEFARKDTDGDALLSFKEHAYRSEDVEFWKADSDGDDRLSLDEFKTGRPGEPDENAEAVFKLIDQNGDGSMSVAEFRTPPAREESKSKEEQLPRTTAP